MHRRTFFSVGVWIAIALALWVIAWVIAEAIPVFNDLLSLITALFASWFTCRFPLCSHCPCSLSNNRTRRIEWSLLAIPQLGTVALIAT